MKNVIGIIKQVEGLLDEMYVLGKAEGIKENEDAVEEAHSQGFDEGYAEAKRKFNVPDL